MNTGAFSQGINEHILFLQIEEIKALMEEMELDHIEVELEVEVEVDSDAEDDEAFGAHISSDDAESDGEEDDQENGESAETQLSACDRGFSRETYYRDSLDSLSEDSLSSGDSDCGSPAAHEVI